MRKAASFIAGYARGCRGLAGGRACQRAATTSATALAEVQRALQEMEAGESLTFSVTGR